MTVRLGGKLLEMGIVRDALYSGRFSPSGNSCTQANGWLASRVAWHEGGKNQGSAGRQLEGRGSKAERLTTSAGQRPELVSTRT